MRSHRYKIDGAVFFGKLREAWICDKCEEVCTTNELIGMPWHWTPIDSDPYPSSKCPNCGCTEQHPFNYYNATRKGMVHA